jgi:hypothetical protein
MRFVEVCKESATKMEQRGEAERWYEFEQLMLLLSQNPTKFESWKGKGHRILEYLL